jgi:hypothetical protein
MDLTKLEITFINNPAYFDVIVNQGVQNVYAINMANVGQFNNKVN